MQYSRTVDAMLLLEHRGCRTHVELGDAVKDVDLYPLSFIGLCCAVYEKPYAELNNFADEGALQAALDQAREAGANAKEVEDAIQAVKDVR